jgi:hypothetical protein
MTWRLRGLAMAACGLVLSGCTPQTVSTTGSSGAAAGPAGMVASAAAPTPKSRYMNLAWNAAWAETCGFNVDFPKLRSSYLAYEAANGAPPADMENLGASLDKARGLLMRIVASKPDQCDAARIERIRGSMARYVANDFSPGAAV